LRISEPALLKSRSKCFMVIPPISSGIELWWIG
jgi:hypothetical protein